MKTFHAVALSLLTGAGLGGATVQVLQAQAKAPVYYVAEVEITDAAGYQKEFVPRAQALMGRAGGQFLVQGGKTSSLNGEPPKPRVVISKWENADQLMGWYNSAEQRSLREIQYKYSKVRAFSVEGVSQ